MAVSSPGASNRDISEGLKRSPRTIEHHVSSVLAKLNVANPSRGPAGRWAFLPGLYLLRLRLHRAGHIEKDTLVIVAEVGQVVREVGEVVAYPDLDVIAEVT